MGHLAKGDEEFIKSCNIARENIAKSIADSIIKFEKANASVSKLFIKESMSFVKEYIAQRRDQKTGNKSLTNGSGSSQFYSKDSVDNFSRRVAVEVTKKAKVIFSDIKFPSDFREIQMKSIKTAIDIMLQNTKFKNQFDSISKSVVSDMNECAKTVASTIVEQNQGMNNASEFAIEDYHIQDGFDMFFNANQSCEDDQSNIPETSSSVYN